MKIEVCGSGCAKCLELEKRTRAAVSASGLEAAVEHIYDTSEIIKRGIYVTPALVVDGKTVASGKIPSVEEIGALLGKAK
ncbi:MAG: TM0996/MTH895 family glutaredoxin-like protein [Elusimicrobia bacterium]|nr:TM0996/MTH895 family glutaredoxin-like protein [Elusimicrobiota bacterium]